MSNPQAWFHLGDEKTTVNVNAIQNIVDTAAQYLVKTVQNNPNNNQDVKLHTTENVKLEVKPVINSTVKSQFSEENKSEITLSLSTSFVNDTVVVLKSYDNLGCIINGQQSCSKPNISKKQKQVLICLDTYP